MSGICTVCRTRPVARWEENPCWQHFCGEECFQYSPSIDPSSLTRFSHRIGVSGCEEIMEATIDAGLDRHGEGSPSVAAGAGRNLQLILRRLRLSCLWIQVLDVSSAASLGSGDVQNSLGDGKHRHTGVAVPDHRFP
ncbi:MAG: transposase [Gammaproteobacteria bacterium]|nr:transposase [Gammaproteobacteria bacterium]MYJ52256.1 transposase [Gammaproteobacteria bacterium]